MESEAMRRRLVSAVEECRAALDRVENRAETGEWSMAVWEARDAFNAASRVQSACERANADDLPAVTL